MKKIFWLLIFSIFWQFNIAQQYIVEFPYSNKEDLKKLQKIISIDAVKNGMVRAYIAGDDKLELFKKQVPKFNFLPKPSEGKVINMAFTMEEMANWDRYPTYDLYVQMMKYYAQTYPNLCILDTIGVSQQGRFLLVLKISDNPNQDENEPEFFYTSSMHGDEVTGYVLMLRFIDELLTQYGKDPYITNLVNNIEIWINPLANPDGTYSGGNNTVADAQRFLANGVDPNRNFPDPEDGDHPDGEAYAPETIAMMDFANEHNFVMSANMHGGAEVFNYPWDTWTSSQNPHADDNWFEAVGLNYISLTRDVEPNYATDVTNSGVTEGADWYEVQGGRQDYMNFFHHCREVTLELSLDKLLSSDELPTYWNILRNALYYYMEQSLYGIRGVVMDENLNPINNAMIFVNNHDDVNDSSMVFSSNYGDYHRLIYNGEYTITCQANGYSAQNATVQVNENRATIKDFFYNTRPYTNIIGLITDSLGNPIEDMQITLYFDGGDTVIYTNSNGYFTLSNMPSGTYKVVLFKEGFMNLFYWETFTPENNYFEATAIPVNTISGYVVDALSGQPLPNAKVEVLNSGIKSVLTNERGFFVIEGIDKNTNYQIKAFADGFDPQTKTLTTSDASVYNLDFALLPSNAISFEDSIPSEFSFSGDANWFRTNSQAYSGDYSLQSGTITDNQVSTLEYTKTLNEGTFGFYLKVSSESGYDFLKFYIDNQEQGSWSGEIDWFNVSYDITAGTHTFKWEYSKDGSVSEGEDCAWIDYITIPNTTTFPQSNVSFVVNVNSNPVEGATVQLLGYGELSTNNSGLALFENVYNTTEPGLKYIVSYPGYESVEGNAVIRKDTVILVDLTTPANVKDDFTFSIYPNPVSDYLSVQTNNAPQKVEIYSVEGKLIEKLTPNSDHIFINFKNIENGIYIIKIYTKNRILTSKIIKQ